VPSDRSAPGGILTVTVLTLDFLFFDAGGGHRAAATALQFAIQREQRPWNVRLAHLKDILDPIDVFRKVTRIDLQEIYNLMLRRGWTLGSAQGLRFMQQVIRLYHRKEVRLLAEHWRRAPADMAVSLVPNFNRAMFEAFAEACPGRPYVTILTDLADYPPRFWIERQRQYFVCGTARAAEQASALGHPPERVFQVSGMILNPGFYDLPPVDRGTERESLGLDPALPTALVLFGGYGSGVMRTILAKLDASGLDLQLILIAGRNDRLRVALETAPARLRKHVAGFTTEVPRFMQLADFFIGKPGPGSLSEALHMGLPAITVRNAWTLPQERFNADWLLGLGAGLVLRHFRDIAGAVREMLAGDTLARMQGAARSLRNRALFEVPSILDTILKRHP
jgi:hypothetical protein